MKDFDTLLQVHKINITYHGLTPRGVEEWEASFYEVSDGGRRRELRNAIEATPREAVKVALGKCGRSSRVSLRDRLKLWAYKWVRPIGAGLLLLFALSATATAQDKARAVEPIRVSVKAPQDEANASVATAVRRELSRLRDVEVADGRPHFIVRLNANRVASEKCRGYCVAVDVVDVRAGVGALDSYTGSTPQEVAAFIVDAANKERFAPYRAGAQNRRK